MKRIFVKDADGKVKDLKNICFKCNKEGHWAKECTNGKMSL